MPAEHEFPQGSNSEVWESYIGEQYLVGDQRAMVGEIVARQIFRNQRVCLNNEICTLKVIPKMCAHLWIWRFLEENADLQENSCGYEECF